MVVGKPELRHTKINFLQYKKSIATKPCVINTLTYDFLKNNHSDSTFSFRYRTKVMYFK